MSICKHALFTNQCDIWKRKNALNTLTKLGYNCCHTLTGFIKSGAMHVSLSWNTTHIKTCTTNLRALEDNNLQAFLGCIFSGAVTAWARADDNQISFVHSSTVYKSLQDAWLRGHRQHVR